MTPVALDCLVVRSFEEFLYHIHCFTFLKSHLRLLRSLNVYVSHWLWWVLGLRVDKEAFRY
jgi:hypothetical protein